MVRSRRNSIILTIVLDAIILIIAFLFWPKSNRIIQSNKINSSKTQIQIKEKRLNIRQSATVDSEDLGDVYEGEVYTVLSHVDNNDYYWYHIVTETGIDGYIASNRENEYVNVISGYIDRTPPKIEFDGDFIEILDDDYLFDSVSCEDDYSECGLSYEINNPETATFKAVDDDGNTSYRDIKYYKVYSLYSEYYDNRKDVNAKFLKNMNGSKYLISATYSINSEISNENKSINYVPLIDFYDEHFNRLNDVHVSYNSSAIPSSCMNDSNSSLKEEYLTTSLLKGNSICINYSFDNSLKEIKYVAFGFTGVENYDNPSNLLASYYSKYFKIDLK